MCYDGLSVIGDDIYFRGCKVAQFVPGVWPTLRDAAEEELRCREELEREIEQLEQELAGK